MLVGLVPTEVVRVRVVPVLWVAVELPLGVVVTTVVEEVLPVGGGERVVTDEVVVSVGLEVPVEELPVPVVWEPVEDEPVEEEDPVDDVPVVVPEVVVVVVTTVVVLEVPLVLVAVPVGVHLSAGRVQGLSAWTTHYQHVVLVTVLLDRILYLVPRRVPRARESARATRPRSCRWHLRC